MVLREVPISLQHEYADNRGVGFRWIKDVCVLHCPPAAVFIMFLKDHAGAALAVSLAVSSMTLGAKTCTGNQSLVQPGARLLIGAAAGNFLTAYLPESVLTERCLNRSKEEFLSLYGPPHCKSGKPGIMKVRIKGEIQYVDPVFLGCSEAEIESDEFWHYRTGEFDGVVIGFKYGKAVFVKEEHRLHMEVVAK